MPYGEQVTRTTVDVGERALNAARRVLGAKALSETVNAALRDAARRRTLKGFDVVRDVDGAPHEVVAGASAAEHRGRSSVRRLDPADRRDAFSRLIAVAPPEGRIASPFETSAWSQLTRWQPPSSAAA